MAEPKPQPAFGNRDSTNSYSSSKAGKAYIKISAAYRASDSAPDYPDLAPLAHALIAANPQRILWGSDWPHPDTGTGRKPGDVSPLLRVDDGRDQRSEAESKETKHNGEL